MFVMFVGSVIFKGPNDAFKNAGPKLGARVEKHLITGDKFSRDKSVPSTKWVEK
jgi:hypothetical protein